MKKALQIALAVFIILIIAMNVVFITKYTNLGKSFTGKVISAYDDATNKFVCKQQSYESKEYYDEQVPYQSSETYTEVVSGKSCDYVNGCYCIHTSWLGLGACDSCKCTKERSVTKYKTETKSRTITKLKDVCIYVKKWQTPNYNDNWLTYPEIYDKNGQRIYQ
ncbi:MAG TPA: hypothetical protein VJB89_01235 [Candidatus Nanoarchaeia archaeon]|nr:hypothetical protein [Candidatus Nanoarchaeia archaeon]